MINSLPVSTRLYPTGRNRWNSQNDLKILTIKQLICRVFKNYYLFTTFCFNLIQNKTTVIVTDNVANFVKGFRCLFIIFY
jgi:hypothetical protein